MDSWAGWSREERALLNPAFLTVLLWQAALGHQREGDAPLPFELAYLVAPFTLHRETRQALPASTSTSLAAWFGRYPLAHAWISDRARLLSPFSRAALMFGGLHGLLSFGRHAVAANRALGARVADFIRSSGDEVRACANRAQFIGRWFARAGDGPSVMGLVGVRP